MSIESPVDADGNFLINGYKLHQEKIVPITVKYSRAAVETVFKSLSGVVEEIDPSPTYSIYYRNQADSDSAKLSKNVDDIILILTGVSDRHGMIGLATSLILKQVFNTDSPVYAAGAYLSPSTETVNPESADAKYWKMADLAPTQVLYWALLNPTELTNPLKLIKHCVANNADIIRNDDLWAKVSVSVADYLLVEIMNRKSGGQRRSVLGEVVGNMMSMLRVDLITRYLEMGIFTEVVMVETPLYSIGAKQIPQGFEEFVARYADRAKALPKDKYNMTEHHWYDSYTKLFESIRTGKFSNNYDPRLLVDAIRKGLVKEPIVFDYESFKESFLNDGYWGKINFYLLSNEERDLLKGHISQSPISDNLLFDTPLPQDLADDLYGSQEFGEMMDEDAEDAEDDAAGSSASLSEEDIVAKAQLHHVIRDIYIAVSDSKGIIVYARNGDRFYRLGNPGDMFIFILLSENIIGKVRLSADEMSTLTHSFSSSIFEILGIDGHVLAISRLLEILTDNRGRSQQFIFTELISHLVVRLPSEMTAGCRNDFKRRS